MKLKPLTASMHLKTLESAAIVIVTRSGTRRIYSLNVDAPEPARQWLQRLQGRRDQL